MAEPVDDRLPVSPEQLGELLDRHAAALALYAAQWSTAADDCVQEALIELARQRSAPENPVAWLYRVVRNRALNASRSAQRRLAHEREAAERRGAAGGGAIGRGKSGGATGVELSDALATLEPAAREIVVLRIWGQLAWQEIADVVGGSKSAAQRNYVEALKQLRTVWEPQLRES
jgi:RNA polymerase sigma-70 factor (ECF subfamily)